MKKICAFLFIYFIKFGIIAQTADGNNFAKTIDFLPAAPNATAIAKANFFNLNKNTGAPNIQIPLLAASGKNLSVNIGLTYASNGIRVDEMPSNVGMGWSLNVGGVVSRTIKGFPDENHKRIAPWHTPLGENFQTAKFCSILGQNSNKFSGYDSEPDIFTFNCNGQSGSFMLDADMKAVQIPYGNFKIEVKLGNNEPWNVKIINSEGVVFYFGGENATEKSKQTNSCSAGDYGNYTAFFPSAWYLKKIVGTNGEEVFFEYIPKELTYISGISETINQYSFPLYGSSCPPDKIEHDNISMADIIVGCKITQVVDGIALKSIKTLYSIVEFDYLDQPYNDRILVEKITLKDITLQTLINKEYLFKYVFPISTKGNLNSGFSDVVTNPYLQKITELKSTNEYSFNYIEPENRCNRLSFSQDHWGFFNGKLNETLIAPPPSTDERDLVRPLPNANANREPDFKYAVMGMLNKIVYPTGGIDSIIYEPNSVNTPVKNGVLTKYTCSVTGVGLDFYNTVYKDIPFTFDTRQDIKIEATSICTNCNDNPLHYQGSIQVIGIDGVTVYNEVFFLTSVNPKKITLYDLAPGSYIIKIMARTSLNTTTATIKYYPKLSELGFTNKIVGGVRVKKILNGNKNEIPTIKNYYYGELDNLNVSSCNVVTQPLYGKKYKMRYYYPIEFVIAPIVTYSGIIPGATFVTGYNYCYRDCYGMFSNTLTNLFNFQGNTVSYESVVESFGDNFENGGIQSKFNSSRDVLGVPIWGDAAFNGPVTNYSIYHNGKLKEENVLKYSLTKVLFTIKQTKYKYTIKESVINRLDAFQLITKYNSPYIILDTTNLIPSKVPYVSDFVEGFDIIKYSIEAPWVVLSEVETKDYDENGLNPQTNITKYFYGNEKHQQITKIETKDSKGFIKTNEFAYPHDLMTTNYVSQQMVGKNIISPQIKSLKYKNDALLEETYNEFDDRQQSGIFQLASVSAALNGSTLENQGRILKRDKLGNVLEYVAKDEIINSIIWGYKDRYPIAKLVGVKYDDAKHTLATVTNLEELQFLTGNNLLQQLILFRNALPTKTMMTTYTYIPGVGVETISDVNAKLNTYIYNASDQLFLIKDQDNHIIKQFTYNYAGSDIQNTYKLFYNTAQSITVRCGPCLHEGTIGKAVTYQIPEKQYFSSISQADANNKAIQDIQMNAQSYVNSTGYCSNDEADCTGPQYKKIGCKCELGVKICISSRIADPGEQGYYNTYRYKWSDNSMSDPFVEFSLLNCQGLVNQL